MIPCVAELVLLPPPRTARTKQHYLNKAVAISNAPKSLAAPPTLVSISLLNLLIYAEGPRPGVSGLGDLPVLLGLPSSVSTSPTVTDPAIAGRVRLDVSFLHVLELQKYSFVRAEHMHLWFKGAGVTLRLVEMLQVSFLAVMVVLTPFSPPLRGATTSAHGSDVSFSESQGSSDSSLSSGMIKHLFF